MALPVRPGMPRRLTAGSAAHNKAEPSAVMIVSGDRPSALLSGTLAQGEAGVKPAILHAATV
jgi:hypothetical protein